MDFMIPRDKKKIQLLKSFHIHTDKETKRQLDKEF